MLIGGSYYAQVFAVRVFEHVLITALLSVWLIVRQIRGRGLPSTPLNPLLGLMVLVWFASALLSLDPRMALENLWIPLTDLLLFFVMVDVLQRGRETLLVETQFLLTALVVMLALAQLGSWWFGWGFATSTIGWASVVGADVSLPLPRLFVPLGVSTWLAAYTAPLAVLAGAWGWAARRRGVRYGFWLLAALLALIMVLTGSRGGWISLGAGAALLIALQLFDNPRFRQMARRYLPLLLIAGAGAAAVMVLAVLRLSADTGHSSGDVLRFDLWRGAVQIAGDHPFLGVGPGLFGQAYRLYRDPSYVDNRLGTAHNFYLNALAETGMVGVLIALALGVVLIRAWWRNWRSADTSGRRIRLAGAFAALVGFGIQSGFDTFTSVPLVLLALGLTAYCITRARLDAPRGSRPAAWASLALVLIFGAGLLRSDQGQAAFIAGVNGSVAAADQAVALDPSLRLYTLQTAYLSGLNDDPAHAITAYQHALDLEPSWDKGWINLAALDQRQGETAQALDALQHAIDIDNRNGALLMWARLAEQTGSAPPEAISDAYVRYLSSAPTDDLPLAAFWTQTDLRRQALERYLPQAKPDLRYRIAAAHNFDLATLVPADPVSGADWWVVGEYALTVSGDPMTAEAAFTQAIRAGDVTSEGDYYASRARARVTLDPQAAARDLDIAELLRTYDESPNAVRALLATDTDQRRSLLANAVPPEILDQNFEGVLFAGRVAAFQLLPEMRLPGPGASVMQPWYDLAASYLADGDPDQAVTVYRAILDRAPDESAAQEVLDQLGQN